MMNIARKILESAFLTSLVSSAPDACSHQPRVFAHYMPWFKAEPNNEGEMNWEHWAWRGPGPEHDPDKLPNGRQRNIASVYYPMIGPYDGRDPFVLEYHIAYAGTAHGHFVWNANGLPRDPFYKAVAAARVAGEKGYWVGGAHPGFDDSGRLGVGAWSARQQPARHAGVRGEQGS